LTSSSLFSIAHFQASIRDFVDFAALLCHRRHSAPPAPGNVFMSRKSTTTKTKFNKEAAAKGGPKG
jgi:hypothetical protein